tara:strand:- start:576 stop:968 length:393 start_codon:yes stop_codon:yes gene_type:complete
MLNFFSILLIIFIVIFLLIFKIRKIKSLINTINFNSNNLLDNKEKNIKYLTNKDRFNLQIKGKKYSEFHKKNLRNKMFKLYQSNTEDKLKALRIAEELADKSTLPILRRGLKDTSPEIVEKSATLIRKFK